jgi:hypothetical protein
MSGHTVDQDGAPIDARLCGNRVDRGSPAPLTRAPHWLTLPCSERLNRGEERLQVRHFVVRLGATRTPSLVGSWLMASRAAGGGVSAAAIDGASPSRRVASSGTIPVDRPGETP